MSSGDVQHVREALGARLRELRRAAGPELTGKALAARLGWDQSKVSRIELGRQTPSREDITAWTDATGAAAATGSLLAQLEQLDTFYAAWSRQFRGELATRQRTVLADEAALSLLRVFESSLVPGLLQTPEYARVLFTTLASLHGTVPDVEEAIRIRLKRQELLRGGGRRFHFVLGEASLRSAPPAVMVEQLGRLLTLAASSTIRIGVIPFGRQASVVMQNSFWLHDDRLVLVETFAAELRLTQPEEIRLYAEVFARLSDAACYGPQARALMGRALAEATAPGRKTAHTAGR